VANLEWSGSSRWGPGNTGTGSVSTAGTHPRLEHVADALHRAVVGIQVLKDLQRDDGVEAVRLVLELVQVGVEVGLETGLMSRRR